MAYTIPNNELDYVDDQEKIEGGDTSQVLNREHQQLLENCLSNKQSIRECAAQIIDEVDNPDRVVSLEYGRNHYTNLNNFSDLKNKVDSITMFSKIDNSLLQGYGFDFEVKILPVEKNISASISPGTTWNRILVSTVLPDSSDNLYFPEKPSFVFGTVEVDLTETLGGNPGPCDFTILQVQEDPNQGVSDLELDLMLSGGYDVDDDGYSVYIPQKDGIVFTLYLDEDNYGLKHFIMFPISQDGWSTLFAVKSSNPYFSSQIEINIKGILV